MKKIVIAGMLTLAVSLFAEVNMNDKKTIDLIGLDGLKKSISKVDKASAGRWFLYRGKNPTYRKVRNDEFELDGAIEEAYTEFISKINSTESFVGKTSELRLGSEFGKYNFKKKEFPITVMSKNSYVSFGGADIIIESYSSQGAKLSFDNVNNAHSVLPMVKADAKQFMKSRKNSRGNVDRSLTARYSYVIKSVKTPVDYIEKCKENFRNCQAQREVKIVGHITKLEILGKEGKVLYTYSDYK
jgi:hypothetical protein